MEKTVVLVLIACFTLVLMLMAKRLWDVFFPPGKRRRHEIDGGDSPLSPQWGESGSGGDAGGGGD
ncbi:hypothetical protein ABWH92_08030 [Ahrensia marina]|uniref:hypothetical protein n=1 Tax=Ahrensia marina TaxID=1514904 RepID=UPI0035D11F28